MSKADQIFVSMCTDIIENGTTTKGQKVRPKWEDGTPAYTIKKFGVVNRYDLREEFPALTLRKTALKSAMDEILWIFQRKSNNISKLKPHIWDEWADENGSIGKAYGYQIGERYIHHRASMTEQEYRELKKRYPSLYVSGFSFSNKITSPANVMMDQMDAVLYDLENNPFSRRIITNIFNMCELHEMNLQPCCWSCNFNVTDEGRDGKLTLNMVLTQRSNDVLAANNWNVAQYSLLLMMVAQSVGMEAGVLLHCITDAHIYDRHVPLIKELITREQHPAPIVRLNPNITNFYDFTTDDLIVENYITGEQIKNIPIAI